MEQSFAEIHEKIIGARPMATGLTRICVAVGGELLQQGASGQGPWPDF